MIGVNHDRYIYLVGGRSKNGPVITFRSTTRRKCMEPGHSSSRYSCLRPCGSSCRRHHCLCRWREEGSRPIARRMLLPTNVGWAKSITRIRNKIDWSKLPAHPGPGRFGIVAGAGERDHEFCSPAAPPTRITSKVWAGRKLAEISPVTFAFEVHGSRWETITEDTFDVRSTDAES